MNVRYRVELSQAERDELTAMLSGGKHAARRLKRAQILLAADAGRGDEQIARTVMVGGSTVYRTKRRFVEGNLERALSEEPRPGAERKLSGKEEALLVATACAKPPQGRARWTLELLAGEMVKLTDHERLSHETVRRRLAENHLKPWRQEMWCIPRLDGEYVARMEDVLDLYAEPPDPNRPVVCFDESPVQLIGEVRQPIPAEPGQLERYDYEYRRNGTVNLFMFLDANRPWRKVKVTARRTAEDYAHCMRDLVDVHYPNAETIRVVQDNLSSHSAGALYQAFAPAEARRILRRLDFHFTPKHASWLNMVEIEIGVLRGQCLDRRIDDPMELNREIAAWERQRNTAGARINWMFTTDKARSKMGPAYPSTSKEFIITVQSYSLSERGQGSDPGPQGLQGGARRRRNVLILDQQLPAPASGRASQLDRYGRMGSLPRPRQRAAGRQRKRVHARRPHAAPASTDARGGRPLAGGTRRTADAGGRALGRWPLAFRQRGRAAGRRPRPNTLVLRPDLVAHAVLHHGRRATAAAAHPRAGGPPVTIETGAVVVAAGTIGTPKLLVASDSMPARRSAADFRPPRLCLPRGARTRSQRRHSGGRSGLLNLGSVFTRAPVAQSGLPVSGQSVPASCRCAGVPDRRSLHLDSDGYRPRELPHLRSRTPGSVRPARSPSADPHF